LVENYNNKVCDGRNSQNIKIFFESEKSLIGKKVKVTVVKALANSMFAELSV